MAYKSNTPSLWLNDFPVIKPDDHKYDRGHSVIIAGPKESTGATKLAVMAALRIGSGLVSVACDNRSLGVYASSFSSVMTKPVNNQVELELLLKDKRVTSVLIGPGSGVNDRTKSYVNTILGLKKNCVLDADALTVFKTNPNDLFKQITGNAILTPHEGEFKRLFELGKDKIASAIKAAKKSNAVIVLKGSKTIIASPNGEIVINETTTPFLATAGTGDVLSGIITGLVAQKVDLFKAACMGVWIHSQAGIKLGPGMISDDLITAIPQILSDLYKK